MSNQSNRVNVNLAVITTIPDICRFFLPHTSKHHRRVMERDTHIAYFHLLRIMLAMSIVVDGDSEQTQATSPPPRSEYRSRLELQSVPPELSY